MTLTYLSLRVAVAAARTLAALAAVAGLVGILLFQHNYLRREMLKPLLLAQAAAAVCLVQTPA
jgi:hypothetical protein